MTAYIVLGQSESGYWTPLATQTQARSAREAIRLAIKDGKPEHSAYVAVPARSFRPVSVQVETKTKVTFS